MKSKRTVVLFAVAPNDYSYSVIILFLNSSKENDFIFIIISSRKFNT